MDASQVEQGPPWAALAAWAAQKEAQDAARQARNAPDALSDQPADKGLTATARADETKRVNSAKPAEMTPLEERKEAARKALTDPAEAEETEKKKGSGPNELTPEQEEQVDKLRARDREVRDHEQAHARVGGPYASAPSYSYQVGPDGKRYAIGGEVKIDVSPIPDNPEATITKMQIVKAAALAPAEPSSADRAVAQFADAQRAQAQADLTAQAAAERRGEEVDQRV